MIPDKALKAARNVARRVSSNQRGLVSVDELLSECYLWLAEHPDQVEQWDGEGKAGTGKLYTSLYRQATRHAMRERRYRTRTEPEDHYLYSKAVVEELLADVWDREAWAFPSATQDTGKVSGGTRPDEGNNRLAMLSDIAYAVAGLADDDKAILRDRYADGGMHLNVLAVTHGITEDGMRKKVDRILSKVCDRLGGEPPMWVGGRRARSNAQAQFDTKRRETGA